MPVTGTRHRKDKTVAAAARRPTKPKGGTIPPGKAARLPANIRNSYLVRDAIDFTAGLKGRGIAGVATSPPYNKAFNNRGGRCSNWASSRLMADNYSHFEDNMSDEDYVAWQRRFIATALDSLGEGGGSPVQHRADHTEPRRGQAPADRGRVSGQADDHLEPGQQQ